jgi:hypothetical protein
MSKGNELQHYRQATYTEPVKPVRITTLSDKLKCFFGFHLWGPTLDDRLYRHVSGLKVVVFHEWVFECRHCHSRVNTKTTKDVSVSLLIKATSCEWECFENGINYWFWDTLVAHKRVGFPSGWTWEWLHPSHALDHPMPCAGGDEHRIPA